MGITESVMGITESVMGITGPDAACGGLSDANIDELVAPPRAIPGQVGYGDHQSQLRGVDHPDAASGRVDVRPVRDPHN